MRFPTRDRGSFGKRSAIYDHFFQYFELRTAGNPRWFRLSGAGKYAASTALNFKIRRLPTPTRKRWPMTRLTPPYESSSPGSKPRRRRARGAGAAGRRAVYKAPPPNSSMKARMDDLFHRMEAAGASDLHMSVSMPPMVRKDGKMKPLGLPGVDDQTRPDERPAFLDNAGQKPGRIRRGVTIPISRTRSRAWRVFVQISLWTAKVSAGFSASSRPRS